MTSLLVAPLIEAVRSIENEINRMKIELEIEKAKSLLYVNIIEKNLGIQLDGVNSEDQDISELFNEYTKRFSDLIQVKIQMNTMDDCKSPIQTKRKIFKRITIPLDDTIIPLINETSSVAIDPPIFPSDHVEISSYEDAKGLIDTIKREMDDHIKLINTDRQYTKHIHKLKTLRLVLFKLIPLEDYTDITKKQIDLIRSTLKSKGIYDRKITNILTDGFTAIEHRLTLCTGYTMTSLDVNGLEVFDTALNNTIIHSTTLEPFSSKKFIHNCLNYSLAIFPLRKTIKRCLINTYNQWNVVYIPFAKAKQSTHSFYILSSISPIRKWDMDCRLEGLGLEFMNSARYYLTSLFRRIYCDIFNDNEYREGYERKLPITEQDCEQLIKNVFELTTSIETSNLLCSIVQEYSTYVYTSSDKFAFISDDGVVRRKWANFELTDDDMIEVVNDLFDNMDSKRAIEFYKSKRYE